MSQQPDTGAPLSISEAVAEVARWGNTIRAFQRISSLVASLPALQQQGVELEARIAQLRADEKAAADALAGAKYSTQAVLDECRARLEAARAEAAKLIDDARGRASHIISDAEAKAQGELAKAAAAELRQREAEKLTAEAIARAQAAAEEMAATERRIAEAKQQAKTALGF